MGFSACNERLAIEDEYLLLASRIRKIHGFMPLSKVYSELTIDKASDFELRAAITSMELIVQLR